jgi:hypothetical protein
MKVLIQEASVTFKVNNARMRERFEEYKTKLGQLRGEKRGRESVPNKEEWNQKESADLLGDEISIETNQEEFK